MLTRSVSGTSAEARFWRLAPRIFAVSYLIGAWYITVHSFDSDPILRVILAPVYLLVGPWLVVRNDGDVLPLILVYGALAAYLAWRQLLLALRRSEAPPDPHP